MKWVEICGAAAGNHWCMKQPIWMNDFAVIFSFTVAFIFIGWCFYDWFKHPEDWTGGNK